jgi:RNA polymerase sigma-70 factor, ECF subfamily
VDSGLTDEQLMLEFSSGDVRAFEMLVARHRVKVFNFILRLVGERAKAEDLLQDTWLKVIRGASSYSAKAKFTTWVFTVARNACFDHVRRDAHRQTETLEAPEEPTVIATMPTPEQAAQQSEVRPKLERALKAIAEEQREVFLLREYAGLSFREIAEVTSTPENTVKSRMRYALEGLRRQLQSLGVDADQLDRTVA